MRCTLRSGQPHDVITADTGAFVHRPGFQSVELHAGFHARNGERSRQHKAVESLEIHIATVNNVEGSGLGQHLVQHAHIGPFSVGNRNHCGNRAAQIQQRVQLDGGLGGTKARPRKQAQAQVNGRGIQGVNRLLQFHPQRFIGVQTAGAGDEGLGQIGIDAPVARTVGMRQRAVRDRRMKSQSIEWVVAGSQADFDVRQAIPIRYLSERHSQELIPTRKVTNLVVAIVAVDAPAKLLRMDPVGELRKNQFSSGLVPVFGIMAADGKGRNKV